MKINNKDVKIESDPIDVTPMSEPDPNWSHICSCGVKHKYYSDDPDFKQSPGMCEVNLPTLKWIVDVEAAEDYPEQGHYECKVCGDHIHPKSRMPERRYYVAGRKTIWINGERATEQELKELINEKNL